MVDLDQLTINLITKGDVAYQPSRNTDYIKACLYNCNPGTKMLKLFKALILVCFHGNMDPDTSSLYCVEQIKIPPLLPGILKDFTKAAILTQPPDLLQWSAA